MRQAIVEYIRVLAKVSQVVCGKIEIPVNLNKETRLSFPLLLIINAGLDISKRDKIAQEAKILRLFKKAVWLRRYSCYYMRLPPGEASITTN